ncbi:hypothetical protein [Caulobacter radicis]|uniref:Cap15 family cyclic dinucleotide receptor domain-containing protein n=1 Tax=Caulobacter radicis TaxID=2172650 RepID=UPI001058209D|nr:hypothetical protein [Caulobacter radicis]
MLKTVSYFAFLVLFILIIKLLISVPADTVGWWKAGSASIGLASVLVVVLGQTAAFPWICKLPLVRSQFPNIDGTWDAILASNWPLIAPLHSLPVPASSVTKATIKIVSRLFFVRVDLQSNDQYSKSKTVAVSVKRDPETGAVRLHYVYENTTSKPKETDTGHHHGAAYLDVEQVGEVVKLEGLYWTNRNWTKGMNTAGTIVCVRNKTKKSRKPRA